MTLTNASIIAGQSLGTISSQISVVSRNISNADRAGANAKYALIATGPNGAAEFLGVGRMANIALFRAMLSATAAQGSAAQISDGLDQIDRTLNLSDPTNSRSPASLITKLTSALQNYSAAPDNETAAELALAAARDVVSSLNEATKTTQGMRRQADADIESSVNNVNDILAKFEKLNRDIVQGTTAGADVADQIDQRDALLTQLSQEIGVTTVTRPNNDMVIYTDSGVTLFETTPRSVTFEPTPTLTAGAKGAAVYIDGVQVTGANSPLALRSGAIRGFAQTRDVTAPQFQSQLDEIARGLVAAFAEKDQSGGGGAPLPGLFTYPGAVRVPGPALIPGLAGEIAINANVDPAQGGVLNRLRDGGISGNPAYVYNAGGGAGYSERILQLVNAPSTQQDFDPAAGLGANGSLNAIASGSIGWIGAQRAQAVKDITFQDAMVTQMTQALSNATGVNLDDQMSQMLALENSYQASAKLLETINAMFDTLFAAVRS